MGADKKKPMNEQTNGWLAQVDTESGLPRSKLVSCLPPAGCYSIGKNRLSEVWKSGCGAESGWRSRLERRQ